MITYFNDTDTYTSPFGDISPDTWAFYSTIESQNTSIEAIKSYCARKPSHINTYVLIGIGGSMLGPQMLYHTLSAYIPQEVTVHFVDNLDTFEIQRILHAIDWHHTLCITITKSGNTPETMGAYHVFKEHALQSVTSEIAEHFVFVCDEGENNLRAEADTLDAICFDIPKQLGGRYSILSAVGFLCAQLWDINAKEIIQGALDAKRSFSCDIQQAEATKLAHTLYHAYTKHNQHMWVFFPYFNRGEYIAKWCVQLFAESLGKIRSSDHAHISPTPLCAVGSTDQHSILQLFKEGLNDKYYVFMKLLQHSDQSISIPSVSNESLSYLSGHSLQTILNTQLQATIDSLCESGRPISCITIPSITPYEIGKLCFFFELVCAICGDLFGINAFDQPGVERSKILTKTYLHNTNI